MASHTLFATSSGAPKTGLAPEIITWRTVENTEPETEIPTITELGGGLYVFSVTVPAGDPDIAWVVDLDPDGAESVPASERYATGTATADDEAITEGRLAELDGLGAKLLVLRALAKRNFRLTPTGFDAGGNMTSGVVKVYASQADASADQNALATLAVAATYDGDGNLTSYLSVG